MSSSEVITRVNSSYDDWYGARAVVEEELKAIGKALERIRISSRLQDAFTRHLLAVHHQWCEACPPAREPRLPSGGLEKESPTTALVHTRAAAAHNPMKHKTSDSCLSSFTQTADIMNGLQMNAQDEVDDNNDDIIETSVPSSMTCRVEDEEYQADVNRTLKKPSTEKVASTQFIKLEVLEDEFPNTLLKLEKDHCDVDMDSSKEETPSQQIHEEDVPSQHIESGGQSQFHLEKTNTVSDHLIRQERYSQGHCGLDMAGSSSEAMSHQGPVTEMAIHRSDGTNNTISALSGDVLSQEGVLKDPCLDSYKTVEKTSRTDGKMKKCSHCSKMYFCRHEYQKHLSTHTCQKPYECSVCGEKFSEKEPFDTHVMHHKGESLGQLTRYMKVHTGEKPYECLLCSKRFNQLSILKTHMIKHTDRHQCFLCGKTFTQSSHVEIHMRTHSGEKPYSCDICDFRCSQKGHLTVHMRVHTGEKPCQCSFCGKRFNHLSVLKRHLLTHSGQNRHHRCVLCEKTFMQSSDLKRHMMIHTGQKPYLCSICGKRFTKLDHFKRHMETH